MELLPLLAILLFFWLIVLRPASKRAKEARELQSGLAVGDQVMLTSGIFGTIVELRDDRVVLSIAPGTEIEVVRPAIAQVQPVQAAESADAEPHLDN